MLSGICPDPVRVALSWTPEAEFGGIYQLAGAGGTTDASGKTYTAPLVDPATGKPTGVDLQVIAGGPAVGYLFSEQLMYERQDILLGIDAQDHQIETYRTTPTIALLAPMQLSPDVFIWNPARYHFKSIADIGRSGVPVLYYSGAAYMTYLVDHGILEASQVNGGYKGNPGEWVATGGGIVFEGFAESEPYVYTHDLPAWDKSVAYELIADVGYDPYQNVILTRPQLLTKYHECLQRLIPMIQRATIQYLGSPGRVDALVVRLIDAYGIGGPYSLADASYSVRTELADRLVGNPPSGGFGSFDVAAVKKVIDQLKASKILTGDAAGIGPAAVATNAFVDPTLRLPYAGPYNDVGGVITVDGSR